MENRIAPIVLFVYNRPWHTQQTLEALRANKLADKSVLYIFADGAKPDANNQNLIKIKEVKEIIEKDKWCKEVSIIYSKTNKGLANSIIEGVTEIINRHGSAIVLEDDLLTSPYFLNYMNEALLHYQNKKSVFSISGYNLPPLKMPIPVDYEYDVFVSLRNSSWGWATWADRWTQVDWSMTYFETFIKDNNIKKAFDRGGDDLSMALKQQYSNEIDSWAIRFAFSHFINHAIAIFPRISLVDNIGLDGSGIHCSKGNSSLKNELNKAVEISKWLDCLYLDKRIINAMKSAYATKRMILFKRIVNKIFIILIKKNIYLYKSTVYR